MDLHDFWEREKRWILGVLAGAMVLWIGLAFVRSTYDVDGTIRDIEQAKRRVATEEFYDRSVLDDVEERVERLRARNAELREALAFEPSDRFLLAGKGAPDAHFLRVGRALRREVVDRAETLNVRVADDALRWPQAVEPEDIAETLLGLDLLSVVAERLLEANEAVRLAQPENVGLAAIEQLAVGGAAADRRGRRSRRLTRFGTGRRGRADVGGAVREVVRSVELDMRVRADAPTIWQFLEACRAAKPRVTVREFEMKPGEAGEPAIVVAKLAALVFDDAPAPGARQAD